MDFGIEFCKTLWIWLVAEVTDLGNPAVVSADEHSANMSTQEPLF